MSVVEPLLSSARNRFTMFPIRYNDLWGFYKKQIQSFWTVEEIDLQSDVRDWNEKLTNEEQHFIKTVLGFFAASDGLVQENLASKFSVEVQIPEARAAYAIQIAMEAIHSEMYSLMIDTYIQNDSEKTYLLNAIETIECVKTKAEWALEWINDKNSFAERLFAFACVEGVFFSGSFCSIFWLKKRNLMEGLCRSNELIARDEGMHTLFAAALWNHLIEKPEEIVIYNILESALEIEKEFVCSAIPVDLIGINSVLMSQYLEFVADTLLTDFGYKKRYGTANPFPWMETIGMQGKNNFFETRVTDYKRASVGQSTEDRQFSLDEPF